MRETILEITTLAKLDLLKHRNAGHVGSAGHRKMLLLEIDQLNDVRNYVNLLIEFREECAAGKWPELSERRKVKAVKVVD